VLEHTLKYYSDTASKHTWEVEQTNNKETLEEHYGTVETLSFFFEKKKIKKFFLEGYGVYNAYIKQQLTKAVVGKNHLPTEKIPSY